MKSFAIFLNFFLVWKSFGAINCSFDEKNEYKDVVKIVRVAKDGDRHCTGTLLKEGCFVLTAGHCVITDKKKAETKAFRLKSGPSSEMDLPSVTKVHLHPEYVAFEKNDVAILELSKCVGNGLEIDYEPLVSNSDIAVGGYGVTKLNSFTSQNKRHMGKNMIYSFDQTEFCTKEVLFAEDGITLLEGAGCILAGQDSGSPAIYEGKIKGVLNSSRQRWLKDGKTKDKNCFLSIRNSEIKSFIDSIVIPKAHPLDHVDETPGAQ